MPYSTFCKQLTFVVFIFLIVSCSNESHQDVTVASEEDSKPTLFTLLSSQQTNITFNNILTEGLNTNILMYEYFYNGGGVAAGDFNGDDLIDLYFTSNMSENKLYLNKGNMQFHDVTSVSGAMGRSGPWKTGVTLVDIKDRKSVV